jgi:hypothetical protein
MSIVDMVAGRSGHSRIESRASTQVKSTERNPQRIATCLVKEEGRDHLKFDPAPSRRWILLKLLDDDYLNSNMTDNKYEANYKLLRG